MTPEILFVDNHILVAVKPAGLLTQPDDSGNESLEEAVKARVKAKYEKAGNVFLHAIHRLDRPVSGLVLFARTSKALSRLNEQVRANEIQRIYIAEVEGILGEKAGRLDHYLIHVDHRAIVGREGQEGAKHARLTFEVLEYRNHATLVKIELDTGRYHQIRAQFGATGHPVVGDKKYGGREGDGNVIRLCSAKLLLKHPVTKELLTFETAPPFS